MSPRGLASIGFRVRSPSSRVLINTVDIYRGIQGQDADGGYKLPYASTPTYASIPATVQVGEFIEQFDEQQNRITQALTYRIMTGQPYVVNARDKIVYVDSNNVTHTLQAQANRDEAGRGGAFTIRATETL